MVDENELGETQRDRRHATESQIRQTNSKIDDITDLVETVINNVKVLTFRNLIVIIVLFALFTGYIGFTWLLKPDNKSALVNLIGRSRLVGFVDNCGVVKLPYSGEVVHAVFITYEDKSGDSRYIVSLIPEYDTVIIRSKCSKLYKDRQNLLDNRVDLEKPSNSP